jgi:DNA replication and repair protein RecF
MSLTGFRGLKNNIYNLERVNNLVGDNGSGKTSFLEALYLMCTGVSFLTKATETIANHTTKQFVVEGIQAGTKDSNKILVSYKQHKKTHFLNNKKTTQGKMFLKHPICLVDAFVNRVVSGTPENRRRTIDRALFHVEQEYLMEHRAYARCLKQRNKALKDRQTTKQVGAWDESLSIHGEKITRMREKHILEITASFEEMSHLFLGKEAKIEFKRGWKGGSLFEALKRNTEKDRALKRTSCGPQRDDFTIGVGGKRAQTHISHGQEKMLSLSYIFSQKTTIEKQTNKNTIILFDETDSNLDAAATYKVVEYLKNVNNQILTATHPHSMLCKKLTGKTIFLKQN